MALKQVKSEKLLGSIFTSAFAVTLALPFTNAKAQSVTPTVNHAAEKSPPGGVETHQVSALPDVVVTATRRSERAQSIPISISTADAKELNNRQVHSAADIEAIAPNVFAVKDSGIQPKLFIRGLGVTDFNANASGSVGVYLDDVYLNNSYLLGMPWFDVQDVEVLNGPQGTLYGRNVTGGAINVVDHKPTSVLGGYLNTEYGSYNLRNFEGALNAPLTDKLDARIAFNYRDRDGFAKNLDGGKDIGRIDNLAGRASLRYRPNDKQDWLLSYHFTNIDDDAPPYQFSTPGNTPNIGKPWVVTQSNNNAQKITEMGGVLEGNILFNGLKLTTITGYDQVSHNYTTGGAYPDASFVMDNGFGSSQQYSQEFRLASNDASRFQWVAGLYGIHEKLAAVLNEPGFNLGPGSPYFSHTAYTQRDDSIAEFGQISYAITSQVKVYAGLRNTWEQKNFWTSQQGWFQAPFAQEKLQASWDRPTWSAGVNYQFNKNILTYVSYNRGARSGGFNAGGNIGDPAFGPESVDAFEIGTKTNWFNNRLTLDLSAFYNIYSNVQVYSLVYTNNQPTEYLTNAGSAHIKGVEARIAAQPLPEVTITSNVGFLDARFTHFIGYSGANLAGNYLAGAPKVTFNGAVDWNHPLDNQSGVYGEFNWDARTRTYLTAENILPLYDPGHWFLGFRVGYSFGGGKYDLSVYGKNILNQVAYINALDMNPSYPTFILGDPATYGAQLKVNF